MRVLLLGGTGAMGTPLTNYFANDDVLVDVTTRKQKDNVQNVRYLVGDAHNKDFISEIVSAENYDAVLDFMVYKTEDFQSRVNLLMNSCGKYIFFSSCRVFANSEEPITELSPKLLDVCKDQEYLLSDEYALAKAREEEIVKQAGNNWIIIRPYITYNDYRLQLGVFEKEHWLYRALNGRKIVIPKDIASKRTCLTFGNDVAKAVYRLVMSKTSVCEDYNIVNSQNISWLEVLEFYISIIKRNTGIDVKYELVNDSVELSKLWNAAQIRYDRLYDRIFDNSKIIKTCPDVDFCDTYEGLNKCLSSFILNPVWLGLNIRFEGWADRKSHEVARLSEFRDVKTLMRYFKHRFVKYPI